MRLDHRDIAEILAAEPLRTPVRDSIDAGKKYLIWTKVAGEMQLVTVTAKDRPYPRRLRNGGTAFYVDVWGYGIRKAVNVKKLRKIPGRTR